MSFQEFCDKMGVELDLSDHPPRSTVEWDNLDDWQKNAN